LFTEAVAEQKEMCRREITEVEWTARALARNHKSWKRHFGVRLRAADPYLAALRRVVPLLLADARARGYIAYTADFESLYARSSL
jgi:hypothetical protein